MPARLPWQPQELALLQQRYHTATATVFDGESLNLGLVLEPKDCRQHCFDFADGLRLIIAPIRAAQGTVYLTFVPMIAPDSKLGRYLNTHDPNNSRFLSYLAWLCRRRIYKLSGLKGRKLKTHYSCIYQLPKWYYKLP